MNRFTMNRFMTAWTAAPTWGPAHTIQWRNP